MHFDLLTHKFVGVSNSNDVQVVDKWFPCNQSFWFKNELYPDKIRNQMGRPLRMATFTYEPYTIVDTATNKYEGSELSTALQYAKYVNATPLFVINELDYWGDIYSNWTGSGLLGNLLADNADIGFAALYTWEFCYPYLDLSKPMVRTGITCLVPAPRLLEKWLTPFFSYSPLMWLLVGVLFIYVSVSLSVTLYVYKNSFTKLLKIQPKTTVPLSTSVIQTVTNVIKLFLSQSLTDSECPMELSAKMITFCLLLTSVFLSSTYSSGLASVMTVERYEEPINTVIQFVASGLTWGGTDHAWTKSIEQSEDVLSKILVSRFVTATETQLRNYSFGSDFAFALERLPYDNFAIGSYVKSDVIPMYHLMQQDFYWEQCVMMARKSSNLLPGLDSFILRAFEAGLISYWQNQAVSNYMDTRVQAAVKLLSNNLNSQRLVQLQVVHVQGAFAMMMFGYCLSLWIFIVEILFNRTISYLYPYRNTFTL